ncbi:anti-sigma-D factor RsdA [Mycolicibacterium komossense]|uniref:Anti-sigma-D factor RsdA sigma factor binding region domain-containing protein n=1 Tax=Mycolicibacterium komossense TaxID=1779 RepID=A0ABT3CCV8_9MYCO|nr:anti-sigma-D factor RsdA [Mycolicibacterium komossense]MCV7227334.1 hypothetical protein [Mycolicibacterium komossense]
MADFGRRSSGGESLDAIARTDQLLDAIATERRVQPADADEAELFALLADWRDEVRWPPATDLVTEREAAAALRDGVNSKPAKRGGHRGLTIVASLAAAVLCIGGFGAVVSGAGPGDPLYGLRTALLGEPQTVRDDRVALAAQQEMAQVQTLIDNGDWAQAQQKLASVSTSVQGVDDTARKQNLIDQWNQLAVKVDQRDPAATVPPSAAPGPLEQLTLPSLPETLPAITLPSLPETLPAITLPSLPETLPAITLPSLPDSLPSMTLPSFTLPSLPETLPSMTLPTLPQTLFPGSPSSGPSPQQTVSAPPPVVTTTTAPPSSSAPSSTSSSASASTSSASSPPSSTAPTSAAQSPAAATTTPPATTSLVTPTTTTTTTLPTAAPRAAESQTVEAPAAPSVAQTAPQRAPDVVTTTMPRPILQLPLSGGN